MRTQLILTTAVLGVAGSLGASAQVYSVNAVGYINVSVPAKKFAIVGNQLNAGGNTIKEVIPSAKDGTIVYKYSATGFAANGFEFGEWSDPAMTLKPGVGVFVFNGDAAAQTITLVGEVPQGNLQTTMVQGLNLVASQVPQAGKLKADLKFPAVDGDVVYTWDLAAQAYKANGYEFGDFALGDPQIAVAEGFFVAKAAAASWDRSFTVSP